MTVSSGSQASGRPPPFRPRLPWRGPLRFAFSAWFGFCPFDGGRLELSGVFGGSASLASNSAMRRSAASSRCHSARISASFSAWLSWLRSGSAGTHSLNRRRRDRVNHHLAANRLSSRHTQVCEIKPGMSSYTWTAIFECPAGSSFHAHIHTGPGEYLLYKGKMEVRGGGRRGRHYRDCPDHMGSSRLAHGMTGHCLLRTAPST